MTIRLTRREFAVAGGATLLPWRGAAETAAPSGELLARPIPSSGERLPAVGLGTAMVFDSNDNATRQKASAVLQALIAAGGRLVDTSSVYGDAEAVLGETVVPAGLRDSLFIATKLEASDAAELKRSQTRLQMQSFDLLQFHNVHDPQQSLGQFKDWKAPGVCRYIGITSTRHADFGAIEAVLLREKPDFVQMTIRSTTARPKGACCRPQRRSRQRCSRPCRSAGPVCFAPSATRKFPIGPVRSPKAGRSSS